MIYPAITSVSWSEEAISSNEHADGARSVGSVMNAEKNPFGKIPKTARFQLMVVLSFMWSGIFCLSVGMLLWFPQFVFVHIVLLLVGIFGTNYIFRVLSP